MTEGTGELPAAARGSGEHDFGLVQVEVVPDPRFAGHLSPADLIEQFQDRAGELGSAIGGVAERLRGALEQRLASAREDAWELSEVNLEMALNLEAEAGIVISKAKTGATFQVSMTWSRRQAGDGLAADRLPVDTGAQMPSRSPMSRPDGDESVDGPGERPGRR